MSSELLSALDICGYRPDDAMEEPGKSYFLVKEDDGKRHWVRRIMEERGHHVGTRVGSILLGIMEGALAIGDTDVPRALVVALRADNAYDLFFGFDITDVKRWDRAIRELADVLGVEAPETDDIMEVTIPVALLKMRLSSIPQ